MFRERVWAAHAVQNKEQPSRIPAHIKVTCRPLAILAVPRKDLMRKYNSYLVRHWSHKGDSDGQQIFDIEHIQTGRRMRLASLTEALPWIQAVSLESRETEVETTALKVERKT